MTLTNRERAPILAPHLAKYPTPFHVYYENRLKEDADSLKKGLHSQLPQAELYYSAKTNSLLALLRCLVAQGWNIETVCTADRRQASLAGAKGNQVLLNGAAWNKGDLEDALLGQKIRHLTVDSLAMARLLGAVIKEHETKISSLSLALRIHDGNSHFGFQTDGPAILQALSEVPAPSISELGLHIHSNPPASIQTLEELRTDFRMRTKKLLEAADIVNSISTKREISFFDFGGGIDSPYIYRPQPAELADFHNPAKAESFRNEKQKRNFRLAELAECVSESVAEILGRKKSKSLRILFEPGRAVCSRALSTVIEVRSVKEKFYPEGDVVLTDGNTAILGPLHRGIYPLEYAGEPRNTPATTFVYGNLPHSGDWLFQSVTLPALHEGDRLLISHTGAYFLPLEANFGLPRPGIYSAEKDLVLRMPETEMEPGIRDSV
ncbi:MAG: hypothetical protein ACXWQO_06665 [Bdellovibrionota bacterium]